MTLEDVLGREAAAQEFWTGRAMSLAQGLFAVGSGLIFVRSDSTGMELVNLIGSAFYGPLLGVFTLGVLAPGVNGRQAVAGLGAGLSTNLVLALAVPWLSWLWWNPAGWLATLVVSLVMARRLPRLPKPQASRREVALLSAAFVAMLALLLAL